VLLTDLINNIKHNRMHQLKLEVYLLRGEEKVKVSLYRNDRLFYTIICVLYRLTGHGKINGSKLDIKELPQNRICT
jgi:hypothetical protein